MIGVTVAFSNDAKSGSLYYGCEGIFFYLVTYSLMTLGAFGVIICLQWKDRPVETVDDLAGLGATRPLPALAMAICLLSLSGVPPLAGFWGKLEIFASAFAASTDEDFGVFLMLAVIGVLNAAVGAYYYLRIVVTMYLRPARRTPDVRGDWPVYLSIGVCASLSLILGLFPAPIARGARAAARSAVSESLLTVTRVASGGGDAVRYGR
jgi:NADH-quinone oxidoreductase subunit N